MTETKEEAFMSIIWKKISRLAPALLLILLVVPDIFGQDQTITATSGNKNKELRLRKTNGAQFSNEEQKLLRFRRNFRISRIDNTDPDNPKFENVTATLLLTEDLTEVGNDSFPRIRCNAGSIESSVDCSTIIFNLDRILTSTDLYIVSGIKLNGSALSPVAVNIPVPPTPATTVTATIELVPGGSRKDLRITPPNQTLISATNNLVLLDRYFELSKNGDRAIQREKKIDAEIIKQPEPAQEFPPIPLAINASILSDPTITIKSEKRLAEGQTHNLRIDTGISTVADQQKVEAKGKIPIAGLPRRADNLKLDFQFSTQAAVHQKPFFNFYLKTAPKSFEAANNIFWEPETTIDIGFGDSKSNKSLLFDLPFRSRFSNGRNRTRNSAARLQKDEFLIPNYENWRRTPYASLEGATFFYYGPKLEVEQKFNRANLLGNVKLEFRLKKWRGSIAQQRSYLFSDTAASIFSEEDANEKKYLTEDQVKQIRLKTGFSLTPFVGTEFGSKIFEKTAISGNKLISYDNPRYNIFRVYAGFNNLIEWEMFSRPTSFTISENLFWVGSDELIPIQENTSINIRRIKGFQHRGKAAFDFYLNQARRYSFNITYENGRQAPSFEYLNRVTAGFKFSY